MLSNISALLQDFATVARLSGFANGAELFRHELLPAPHRQPALPTGYQAIYVFSLASKPDWVLKVGKAGANSKARFQSQHYSTTRAQSTLAKSLCAQPKQWPALGIHALSEQTVSQWLQQQTDRDHFFLPESADPFLLNLLEVFLHSRLRPLFEGKPVEVEI